MAWVFGIRDIATVQRLYEKLKGIKNCIFYTDDWTPFAALLPKYRHVVGKKYTIAFEQNNSNTRHFSARFTRRTKVVSKSGCMVEIILKMIKSIAECLFGENIKTWPCLSIGENSQNMELILKMTRALTKL